MQPEPEVGLLSLTRTLAFIFVSDEFASIELSWSAFGLLFG